MKPSCETHILIVNQHGDNRGDEAAFDAMVTSISERVDNAVFTVIHQVRQIDAFRELKPDATYITLKLPLTEALRLVVYLVFRFVGLRPYFLLGQLGLQTIRAYETADIVISAPGGPYFGDLYINHEFVHWLYVWIAALHKKPSLLYATSAGPFEKKWANPFRRFTYRSFDQIFVREDISAQFVRKLLKKTQSVQVSADSALQKIETPIERDRSRKLIVVSAINWHYPNAEHPEIERLKYNKLIIEAIIQLAGKETVEVVFMPQLHDSPHRDAPYLEDLAHQLSLHEEGQRFEIIVLEESSNMRTQRRYFAGADWVIAGRYHPAVFALSAGVPQLCIAYEHKARGVLALAELERCVIDIEDLNESTLKTTLEYILKNRESLSEKSQRASSILKQKAETTSEAVAAVVGNYRDYK